MVSSSQLSVCALALLTIIHVSEGELIKVINKTSILALVWTPLLKSDYGNVL